jgi:hypothetical protein
MSINRTDMAEPHAYCLVDLGNCGFSNWNLPCPKPGVVELAFRVGICSGSLFPLRLRLPVPFHMFERASQKRGLRGSGVIERTLTQCLGWRYLYLHPRNISLESKGTHCAANTRTIIEFLVLPRHVSSIHRQDLEKEKRGNPEM